MPTTRSSSERLAVSPLRLFRLPLLAATCLVAAACSSQQRFIDDRSPAWAGDLEAREQGAAQTGEGASTTPFGTGTGAVASPTPRRRNEGFYREGTGRMLGSPTKPITDVAVEDGQIKLNFQNSDLLQVVKVILGDMLSATYVVDPAVQGEVTMQTSRPLSRTDLVPTLELLLRMNGAAIVMDGQIYRIVPIAKAVTGVRAPQLGDADIPLPHGYGVRIVPLKFVSADEMAKVLEPFVADGKNLLRADTKRNVIILAGDGDDMGRLLEAIRVFDVDRMKGMSVAMFTPTFVDARTLGAELEALLGNAEHGLMAGLVRFLVIDRMNAVMVVTPRADYLAQVRGWVQRLDQESGEGGARLFVYRVQNGKAVALAEALNKVFGYEMTAKGAAPPSLAPGLQPASIQSEPQGGQAPPPDAAAGLLGATAAGAQLAGPGSGTASGGKPKTRVIADEPNNALLIMATNQEYQQILSALRQMDVVPLQVLVDVTIAEVTLGDDLRYGVEWYFSNRINTDRFNGYGVSILDLGDQGVAAKVPGFSYALTALNGDVRWVLNALAQESNLSVLSSPSLLVLNNQEAKIQVGDEVPITTQQQQATTSGGVTSPNIINSIQYRETGVMLTVKPRVNVTGLVTMDVKQEVSRVPLDNNKNELTPRIQTRKINSTVAVQSGDTIILGGLIRDARDRSESGIPILHKIPVIGAAFGTKGDAQARTELLVIITPRAIMDRTAALQVTEEFRRKVNSLIPLDSKGKARSVPTKSAAAPSETASPAGSTLTP
jgi:general secretion pathway protein D